MLEVKVEDRRVEVEERAIPARSFGYQTPSFAELHDATVAGISESEHEDYFVLEACERVSCSSSTFTLITIPIRWRINGRAGGRMRPMSSWAWRWYANSINEQYRRKD